MDELIQGLVAVLERGIVVEPYGTNWTARTGAIRIRLADDPPAEGNREWPDPRDTSW